MNQLPPGARAHIHLGAEGAAVSDDQRSLPRTLFAALCATLILIAAPLAWASTALGADQSSSPVATLSKSGPGHDGDDDDDDDTTGDDTRSGTGSKGTEKTGDGTGRNATTAGGAGDDSDTTTSNSAGTTQTRTTTGGKKKPAANETTRGGANDDTNSTTDNTRGTTQSRTTTGS